MYDFAGLGRQLMHRPRHRVGNQLFSATIYHFLNDLCAKSSIAVAKENM